MKVVLFCGGLGSRLRALDRRRHARGVPPRDERRGRDRRAYAPTFPKALVPIGDHPIIWHLMRYYASFGHDEFVLCLGHGAELIRDYLCEHEQDLGWQITLVDTGLDASVGERLRRVASRVAGDEMFLANYSDGLSDLALDRYVDEFRSSTAIGQLLCVRPSQTFHPVRVGPDGAVVELSPAREADLWINGGFFVFRPEVFEHMHEGEDLVDEPFDRLIKLGQLRAQRYEGFWAAMDTMRDKVAFDETEASGRAPWMVWKR